MSDSPQRKPGRPKGTPNPNAGRPKGSIKPDGKVKNLNIRLDPLTHEALTDAAKKEGLTLTDFVLKSCLEKMARQR